MGRVSLQPCLKPKVALEAQGLTETNLAEVGGAVGGGVCETQGGLSEPKVAFGSPRLR